GILRWLLPFAHSVINGATDSAGMMNGSGLSNTNFFRPRAMRIMVFSASGFGRSNIDVTGMRQSIHSAAERYGSSSPDLTRAESAGPCVGSGHTTGYPSQRATIKKRFRVVGAPKSQARSYRKSMA